MYSFSARPQSQFPHSCVCERFILYIPRIGPNISCSRIGRSIVGIYNSSQAHECVNVDCSRAIPFLGIFVSNFRYWCFAVQAAGLLDPLSFSLAVTQCDSWCNRALSSLSTNMSDDHRKIPIFLFLSNPIINLRIPPGKFQEMF
jgi:hypothetical protein